MDERGLTRARNLALEQARSEIVAFLDDDCTVSPNWLQHVAAVYARHPDASLIFGAVEAAMHDPDAVLIPEYAPDRERILRGKAAFLNMGNVMGASMYVRRSAMSTIGPYDIHAGPGALFKAAEDHDYAYRALAAGSTVVIAPSILVTHHGAKDRSSGEARRLTRTNARAYGAMDMKFLRSGDWIALRLILAHVAMYASNIDLRGVVAPQRPTYVAQLLMYFRGLLAGLRTPVQRQLRLWGRPQEYESPLTLGSLGPDERR